MATRPAVITARGHCCSLLAFRWPTHWVREWAARAAIPTAAISARCSIIPIPGGAHALPMCGGVGAQYAPAAGWAQAITYKAEVLGEGPGDAIALVLGGDASCATGGFWSALTIATTQSLPMLFYVEDNGYGISVPSLYQTPGGDIAANLASFHGLTIFSGDGTEPAEAARLIDQAVAHVRGRQGPGVAAADRAAAGGPQLPGHPDLQERDRGRRRMGARSAAEAGSVIARRRGSTTGARSARRSRPRSKRRAPKPKRGRCRCPRTSPATCSSRASCRGSAAAPASTSPPPTSPRPRASGSTWSPRSAACSTRNSPPIRACWCSARMSGRRAGSMR